MLSTLVEVLGFALLADGTRVLAGPGYALLVAGAALILIAAAAEDIHPVVAVRTRITAVKARRASRKPKE